MWTETSGDAPNPGASLVCVHIRLLRRPRCSERRALFVAIGLLGVRGRGTETMCKILNWVLGLFLLIVLSIMVILILVFPVAQYITLIGCLLWCLSVPLVLGWWLVRFVVNVPKWIRQYRERSRRIEQALFRAYLLRDRMTNEQIIREFVGWNVCDSREESYNLIAKFMSHCDKSMEKDKMRNGNPKGEPPSLFDELSLFDDQ